jgi:organic hydroperoxide reductase OsmC/OhrA
MQAPFPHAYSVEVTRTGPGAAIIDASPRASIEAGPPPEFGGSNQRWSPEHLLLSAVGACTLATFETFAERAKLEILDWHDTVRGTVDKTHDGLAFTSVAIEVELAVIASEVERAHEIFDRAKRHCLVSNSLRVVPIIDLKVIAA